MPTGRPSPAAPAARTFSFMPTPYELVLGRVVLAHPHQATAAAPTPHRPVRFSRSVRAVDHHGRNAGPASDDVRVAHSRGYGVILEQIAADFGVHPIRFQGLFGAASGSV